MLPSALAFARRDDRRVLAGVAGGFADQHGIDPTVLRAVLVVLSFAGGLGLLLYALGAAVSVSSRSTCPPAHPADSRRTVSVVCLGAGALLVVRSTGLWLGDTVMVPLVVLVAGIVVLGVIAPDRAVLVSVVDHEIPSGRAARARLLVGAALVAFGLVLVATHDGVSDRIRIGVYATASTMFGVALVLGPWLARLAREAAEDRRQRIRLHERDAMAAHLHDSVLQTLALIQRTADDPRRTVMLARQQERDLREWLYGPRNGVTGTWASAMRSMVADVESTHDLAIDLVLVGDAALDDASAGLVAATREACVNAAKHSGSGQASVYGEAAADRIECWIRDRGVGFEPTVERERAAAASDDSSSRRRGIADSIVGRLERVGGSASISSAPGAGTEVHLRAPVAAPIRANAGAST